jgi:hypothetical protein
MSRFRACSLGFALILSAPPGAGAATVPDCESYAAAAGHEAGIPDGILPAIARVESGRKGRAWPWTLNQAGASSFHATKDDALQKLDEILATGAQNVDLGCMQLNWRWHSGEFPDAATMLDPVDNTRYAARFLLSLKDRHGDWDSAVAAYHSTESVRGASYGAKVATVRETILAEPGNGRAPQPVAEMTESDAPLVVAGMTRGLLALSGQPLVGRQAARDLRQAQGQRGLFPGPGQTILTADN